MKRVVAWLLAAFCLLGPLPARAAGSEMAVNHYLLLGFNFREDAALGADCADTILLVSVDKALGRLFLTSLMYETEMPCADGQSRMLGDIAREAGYPALLEAVSANYGIEVKQYMAVKAEGLVRVLDAMGGLQLTLTEAEAAHEKMMGVKGLGGAGSNLLDGHGVMQYMRVGHLTNTAATGSSQQGQVITQTLKQALGLPMNEMLRVVQLAFGEMKTNMPITDILKVFALVYNMGDVGMRTLTLPVEGGYTLTPKGSKTLMSVDWNKNREAFKVFLAQP